MKKLLTILLLAIFLFNVTGYYFLQQYYLNQSGDRMAHQLDQKQYDPHQLIELRVPLNMPYYQNTDFQRHDGHIMIKGVDYNYVERKVENGFLVVRCIPNESSGKIRQNTSNYFAKANGIDQTGDQKSGSSKTTIKIAIDDFEALFIHRFPINFISLDTHYPEYISMLIPVQHQASPERPPETLV